MLASEVLANELAMAHGQTGYVRRILKSEYKKK